MSGAILVDRIADGGPMTPATAVFVSTTTVRFSAGSTNQWPPSTPPEEAKQWPESTDEPTETIANKVGYDDPAYFRKLFKRKTGVTPSRYRQRFRAIGKVH